MVFLNINNCAKHTYSQIQSHNMIIMSGIKVLTCIYGTNTLIIPYTQKEIHTSDITCYLFHDRNKISGTVDTHAQEHHTLYYKLVIVCNKNKRNKDTWSHRIDYSACGWAFTQLLSKARFEETKLHELGCTQS